MKEELSCFSLEGSSPFLTDFVLAFEPFGAKANTKLRREAFSEADSNGTGYCSLAEMGKFVSSTLGKAYSDHQRSKKLFRLFRPIFRHAFNNAKCIRNSGNEVISGAQTATGDDYISFAEFRMFTVYLRIYAAMYDIFVKIDGDVDERGGRNENDDSRIDVSEFVSAFHSMNGNDLKGIGDVTSDEEILSLFNRIDTNNGGFILFSEWSTFLKNAEIKADTVVGRLFSGNLKPLTRSGVKKSNGSTNTKKNKNRVKATQPENPSVLPPQVLGAYTPAKNSSSDLKDFINVFEPFAKKSNLKMRQRSFSNCDSNGSGRCSLAAIDRFVKSTLKQKCGKDKGDRLFRYFRPSYIRAFNAAKGIADDDDFINFAEFRILNAFLCFYAGMLDTFAKIDGGGIGRDENDDRRIDYTEWMKEYSRLIGSGFLGLRNMTDADIANSVFQAMDGDNKGMVLFTEFCEYVTSYEVEKKTKMGKLFGGKLKVVHKKADDKSIGTGSVVTDGAEVEVKAPLLIGDVYSYSPEACTTSTELYRFLESFVELSENSSEGKAKREFAFTIADPNCNGYCSLAELESFILVALQKGFSKEESNALFRLFRPCFIRAFTSSKTFAQDHTENDDDFVQSSEFRKFVLFLCIYAVMYDAFTQFDGAKGNEEDMKVNKEEFLEGYQNLTNYGFLALNSLSSNEEATLFFDEMRAGANAVVFSEWCSHLVRIEKENRTSLGGAF